MVPAFTVSGRIARPVAAVFDAVADPAQLAAYFTTGGAVGRLATGATVEWEFHDFPGAFPVQVVAVEPERRIVLQWDGPDDAVPADADGHHRTTVTITFEPTEDGRTLVRIAEGGWADTPAGLAASYGNCEGWTGMLCALKAWLEHGVRLREGFYR